MENETVEELKRSCPCLIGAKWPAQPITNRVKNSAIFSAGRHVYHSLKFQKPNAATEGPSPSTKKDPHIVYLWV